MISPTSSSSFLGIGEILLIGGESDFTVLLNRVFHTEGFEPRTVSTCTAGLELLRGEWVDGIVIVGDPSDMTVQAFTRILRHEPEIDHLPVVAVGSVSDPAEIVRMLRAGLDDYISDQQDPILLIARLKSILRRSAWGESNRGADFQKQDKVIRIGEIMIRPARHSVHVAEKPVDLTASEFRILMMLAGRPHYVFSRDQVFQVLHRAPTDSSDRSIDSHVHSLRRKLGKAGDYIETVRGVGFKIVNGMSQT